MKNLFEGIILFEDDYIEEAGIFRNIGRYFSGQSAGAKAMTQARKNIKNVIGPISPANKMNARQIQMVKDAGQEAIKKAAIRRKVGAAAIAAGGAGYVTGRRRSAGQPQPAE